MGNDIAPRDNHYILGFEGLFLQEGARSGRAEIPCYEEEILRHCLESKVVSYDKASLDGALVYAIEKWDVKAVALFLRHGACIPDERAHYDRVVQCLQYEFASNEYLGMRLRIVGLLLQEEATKGITLDCGLHAAVIDSRLMMLLIEHGIDVQGTRGRYSASGRETLIQWPIYRRARFSGLGIDYAKMLARIQMVSSTLFTIMWRRVDFQN